MEKQIILHRINENDECEFAVSGNFISYEVWVHEGNLRIVFKNVYHDELMELCICFKPDDDDLWQEVNEDLHFQNGLILGAKDLINEMLVEYFTNNERVLDLDDMKHVIDNFTTFDFFHRFFLPKDSE